MYILEVTDIANVYTLYLILDLIIPVVTISRALVVNALAFPFPLLLHILTDLWQAVHIFQLLRS